MSDDEIRAIAALQAQMQALDRQVGELSGLVRSWTDRMQAWSDDHVRARDWAQWVQTEYRPRQAEVQTALDRLQGWINRILLAWLATLGAMVAELLRQWGH